MSKSLLKSLSSFSQHMHVHVPLHLHLRPFTNDRDYDLLNTLSLMVLAVAAFAGFLEFLGSKTMLPFGRGWSIVLLWAGALAAARFFRTIKLPDLLGMILMGMLLRNLPGKPLQGLPKEWTAQLSAFGLLTILVRSGLEINVPKVLEHGWAVTRLTLCPGVTEAFVVAGLSSHLFKMNFYLALSLGFALGSVSPAIVVANMFELQKKRLGTDKGVPSLVAAASSFDDVKSIVGFSVFITLGVGGSSVVLSAINGPLNIAFGIVGGVVAGSLAGCTRLWDSERKCTAIVFCLGLFMMFILEFYKYTAGGALAGVTMGLAAQLAWRHGFPSSLSKGPEPHFAHSVESDFALLWEFIAKPLLFGGVGSIVDFSKLNPSVIPLSIAIIVCGVAVRLVVVFLVSAGLNYSFKERLFVCVCFVPKATVQAALATIPLKRLQAAKPGDKTATDHGLDFLTTCVFAILLCAPIGAILIPYLAPKLLTYTPETPDQPDVVTVHGKDQPEEELKMKLQTFPGDPQEMEAWSLERVKAGTFNLQELLQEEITLVELATLCLENGSSSKEELLKLLKRACLCLRYTSEASQSVFTYKYPLTKLLDTGGNFFRLLEGLETKAQRPTRFTNPDFAVASLAVEAALAARTERPVQADEAKETNDP